MKPKKLKCCVIDDDPLICDLVQHFCAKVAEVDYCLAAGTAMDGLNLLSSQPFDLVFLDFNLPDMNGKSLLDRKPAGVPVVMITSEKDFAIASYDYPDIIDYIIKPVSFSQFYRAVERVLTQADAKTTTTRREETPQSMFVKDGTKHVQLYFDDIYYIKSESNYVLFYLEQKQIMSLTSLKELLTRLPANFVRIHRSYIINTHKIDYIAAEELSVHEKVLPIGQKYKEGLMQWVAKS